MNKQEQLSRYIFYLYQDSQMEYIWEENEYKRLDFEDLPDDDQKIYQDMADKLLNDEKIRIDQTVYNFTVDLPTSSSDSIHKL